MCALALLFIFMSVPPSYAVDPLTVHEAGFGPEIKGLQLGKSMTWSQMINTQTKINNKGPAYVPPSFGVVIADNDKAATIETGSSRSGKWIVVTFFVGSAKITGSGGGIESKVPKSGSLNDLFVILQKNGLNYIATPNIKLREERMIQYSMDKKDVYMEGSTAGDFARWLNQTYSLGIMEQKGKEYEARNPLEGWRVVVSDDTVTVFSMPIDK
jgi:hypothetical protein